MTTNEEPGLPQKIDPMDLVERENALKKREVELDVRESILKGMRTDKGVSIWWDYENCTPPLASSPSLLIPHIRSVFLPYGPIRFIRAYFDVGEQTPMSGTLRCGLEANGVEIRDARHFGKKDTADHHMMTDMLMWAMDNPAPATIVMFSGDKDFSYLLANLSNRGYKILLVESPVGAAVEMKASAESIWKWRDLLSDAAMKGMVTVSAERERLGSVSPAPIPRSIATPSNSAPIQSRPSAIRSQFASSQTPIPVSSTGRNKLRQEFQNLSTPSKTTFAPSAMATPDRSFNGGRPLPVPPTPKAYIAAPDDVPFSKVVAKDFYPLRRILSSLPASPDPIRSIVSVLLVQSYPTVYEDAQVRNWSRYSEKARENGVIWLGKQEAAGSEWVRLAKGYRLSPAEVTKSKVLSTKTPPHSERTEQLFQPLINVIRSQRATTKQPLRSVISAAIQKQYKEAFKMVGAEKWGDYVDLAVRMGVVKLGSGAQLGSEWVRLRSAYSGAVKSSGDTASVISYQSFPSKLSTVTSSNLKAPTNSKLKRGEEQEVAKIDIRHQEEDSLVESMNNIRLESTTAFTSNTSMFEDIPVVPSAAAAISTEAPGDEGEVLDDDDDQWEDEAVDDSKNKAETNGLQDDEEEDDDDDEPYGPQPPPPQDTAEDPVLTSTETTVPEGESSATASAIPFSIDSMQRYLHLIITFLTLLPEIRPQISTVEACLDPSVIHDARFVNFQAYLEGATCDGVVLRGAVIGRGGTKIEYCELRSDYMEKFADLLEDGEELDVVSLTR